MGVLGGLIGHSLGRGLAHTFHLPKNIGGAIGGGIGALEPFKKGGYVGKGLKKGTPVPILAHAGEFVVPLNSKPTKKQVAVAKKNKKSKGVVKFA